MKTKFKVNENSRVLIQILLNEWVEDGKTFRKTQWIEIDKPLSLGTAKKPAKYKGYKILKIKFDVPHDQQQNPIGHIFKGFGDMFGGGS